MHPTMWFAAVKQKLNCKNINKLQKPRPTQEPEDEELTIAESPQDLWMIHDLSRIFEDAEPLLKVVTASKTASVASSSSQDKQWSLLDDPTILRLCSSSTVSNDAEGYESQDPRASSKIVVDNGTSTIYRQEGSVSSFITLDSVAAGPHDLLTTLKLTEDALAWHSAALRPAHDQLQFFRTENAARFDQTQKLIAQVHELERVRGWGKKRLRREIRILTGDLFEQDVRLTMQVHRLRELEDSLWEWKEYALELEGQFA